METVHIGNSIEKKLRQSEIKVSHFAKMIYCDRSNIYKIFKKPNIDTGLLIEISKILNYNFFEEFQAKSL